jgi:NAD(P)-dependent dehydrogenase (short-subunit alcohol dehydrogenase family)
MQAAALFDLSGQVALVTGAASGLGLAISEVLAANGAHVAMLDVNEVGLGAAAGKLSKGGASIETHVVDVAELDRLSSTVDAIASAHGRLDIAVANAGISSGPGFQFGPAGGLLESSPDKWDKVIDVNLRGVFVTMQAAARRMIPRQSGRIVVVASIAGLMAEPNVGYPYAATKAAVVNLVRQAAVELARHNVLVTGIAPGPFRTNIGGGRIADPEVARYFEDIVPLKRIAMPDEIKGLALLLASPASSFMTGVTVPIDGGATAL